MQGTGTADAVAAAGPEDGRPCRNTRPDEQQGVLRMTPIEKVADQVAKLEATNRALRDELRRAKRAAYMRRHRLRLKRARQTVRTV